MNEASGMLHAIVAFFVYIIAILIALRGLRGCAPAFLVVALSGAICAMSLGVIVFLHHRINLWSFLVTYWFMVTSFLMAFGAIYKSLSLRILSDLLSKPGRSDDIQRVFSHYLVEDSYQNRLALMCHNALVVFDDERYALTPKGRRLTECVRTLQIWFGISRSG